MQTAFGSTDRFFIIHFTSTLTDANGNAFKKVKYCFACLIVHQVAGESR